MTVRECLEDGTIGLEDEVDYNDTPKGEEIACLRLEINRLNNIINELEEYIKNMLKEDGKYSDVASRYGVINCEYILDKLKELKEKNND